MSQIMMRANGCWREISDIFQTRTWHQAVPPHHKPGYVYLLVFLKIFLPMLSIDVLLKRHNIVACASSVLTVVHIKSLRGLEQILACSRLVLKSILQDSSSPFHRCLVKMSSSRNGQFVCFSSYLLIVFQFCRCSGSVAFEDSDRF